MVKLFLPGNSVAWGTSMSPGVLRRGTKEEYAMKDFDLNSYKDQDQETNINHLSLNLVGDPLLDPPNEVVLIDPRTNVADVVNRIKNTLDEKLTSRTRLLVTGRLELLPVLLAAAGDFIDQLTCSNELFGAYIESPYGLFCPLRRTADGGYR